MKIEKNRIRLLFYICTVSIVVLLTTSINIMYLKMFSTETNNQLLKLKTSIVDMKKLYVKDIVETTINNIGIEKELFIQNEKDNLIKIKKTVLSILNDHDNNQEIISHVINEHIINEHIIYIFFDLNSNTILYNSRSYLDKSNNQDEIIKKFMTLPIYEVIKTDTHLFLAGVSEEHIDNNIKEISKNKIRKQRFIDDGYIWINYILDYSGGDNYAIRLVHPNLPDTEGSFLSTNTEDIQGNRPYEIELDGITSYGELFNEYYFKKMGEDKIAHKLSYAKLYKDYDWIISTGIYLDDVDTLIKQESATLIVSINQIKKYAIILIIISVFFSICLIILFEHKITKLIISFQDSLNEKNQKIKEEKDLIEKIAYLDPLTEILNRRAMIIKLKEILSKSIRYNDSFSIAIADIDGFKKINDTYGHDAGDLILIKFTQLLKSKIRLDDAVSRWGGEEFLILLNNTNIETTYAKLDSIRSSVEESELIFNGEKIKYTISIGSISYKNDNSSYEYLINNADKNLYKAKNSGKNKVISS